jgi:hypothetical protein
MEIPFTLSNKDSQHKAALEIWHIRDIELYLRYPIPTFRFCIGDVNPRRVTVTYSGFVAVVRKYLLKIFLDM